MFYTHGLWVYEVQCYSKRKLENMSLKERLKGFVSRMRPWVLSGAIGATGGILFYMWAQLPLEKLVASVYFSLLLALSLAILVAFVLMSASVLTKVARVRWKQKFIHGWLLTFGLLSSLAALVVYAAIVGWGPIRSLFNLPHDNLVIASGVTGLTYTFLLTVIFVCVADFGIAGEKLNRAMACELNLPKRKQSLQQPVAVAGPPEDWDADANPTQKMPTFASVSTSEFGGVDDLFDHVK